MVERDKKYYIGKISIISVKIKLYQEKLDYIGKNQIISVKKQIYQQLAFFYQFTQSITKISAKKLLNFWIETQ
jgi:hypothetical protein